MKPFHDPHCECHAIVKEIKDEFPLADWNTDVACEAWLEKSKKLTDNGIEFEDGSDANYACTCPTCGEWICGWCV